ncbi:hypothetical protein BGX21_000665 [Mortierella sp. AD011]|nr:hypothetical protein BGX21_000665 [Mortierella sp. AD011]
MSTSTTTLSSSETANTALNCSLSTSLAMPSSEDTKSISPITSTTTISTSSATPPLSTTIESVSAATTPNHLLNLPIEILEEIVFCLPSPRNFVRCCRQIYELSTSPSVRAKYLWLLHGPDQVLARKVVELHKLTSSILTSPVALLLIAMGATHRDSEEFIFRWACSKGYLDVVRQLLKSKPKIDMRFRSDWFLREAAKNGRQSVVIFLLQQPDYAPSESGLDKAFEAAYEQSHCSTVKVLFDYAEAKGAQMEQSPVIFQSIVPSTKRARRIMAAGLHIQKDADKALRYAVRGNDVEMVKLLIDYEADVHAFNEEAIMVAAHKGHVEILKLLIQAGADFETKAGAPLRQAAEGGHAEAVRVLCESSDTIIATLLDHGANVNIHEGTPLQLACQHGHEAAVRVLLRYGANHRLDDGAAYKLALEGNHENIKALLVQAETTMRAKERELDRIMQQQGPMMMAQYQQMQQNLWYSSHPRMLSENRVGASAFTPNPLFVSASSASAAAAAGGLFTGSIGGLDSMSRGYKRIYSQMSNPLSAADLFRSGSICGLVALDDEIRSRQRSESNRL